MSRLKKRSLEFHFILDKKITFSSGENIKIVDEKLDISAQIKKNGGSDKASISIKNMKRDDIDLLVKLRFKPLQQLNNRIFIYAGYDGIKKLIFQGDIAKTKISFGGDSNFQADCFSNLYHATKPCASTYLEGTKNIDNIFRDLCVLAELKYKNIDVVGITIDDPILKGGSIEQIKQLAKMIDVSLIFDNDECIIKKRGTAKNNEILDINADSGLVGNPVIEDIGISLITQFNGNIEFDSKIRTKTNISQANGIWRVFSLDHNVSSMGEFQTQIKGVYVGELQ